MKTKSYTHLGKKETNEDALGFNNQSFIVCDGVGGAARGDIASTFIVESILKNSDNLISENTITALIEQAHLGLNKLVSENPLLDGTATTIAAAFKSKNGIFTAHAGDSRVYFVKTKAEKFWQTWDHSVVGKLVQNEEITREQGRHHPMNNQIFNAIKGNMQHTLVDVEIHFLSDLEPGDICFICSDGISETFSDLRLLELLSHSDYSIEEKLDQIKTACILESRDNHSAIICEFEAEDTSQYSNFASDWKTISSLRS